MFLVVGFVIVSFLCACVAADGGNVDHAISVKTKIQHVSLSFRLALKSS